MSDGTSGAGLPRARGFPRRRPAWRRPRRHSGCTTPHPSRGIPAARVWLATDQWAGIIRGPWRSWDLNRLACVPDLVDLAERFLGSTDLRLYESELWAKYAGVVDYDQSHHRDFANHTLVVQRSDPATQILDMILLSDVGEEDGPTKVAPLPVGEGVPY